MRTNPPSASFNSIAPFYQAAEYLLLGPALSRTRNQHLHRLRTARSALLLGDGDGRFLARLLRANPQLHATAVDSSSAMLQLLFRRCRFAARRVLPVHAEALHYLSSSPPPSGYDLVTTHFFLDCFTDEDLRTLIPAVRDRLCPGGLWAVSEFRVPAAGTLRLPARLLIRSLYLAFRLLTGLRVRRLPDYAAALRHAGLVRIAAHLRLRGLLVAELWQRPQGTN